MGSHWYAPLSFSLNSINQSSGDTAILPTTNFPNGATNNTAQNALGQMIQLDPSKAHTYFDDFDTYLASEPLTPDK